VAKGAEFCVYLSRSYVLQAHGFVASMSSVASMAHRAYELRRRYEKKHPEYRWECLLGIFFVEEASESVIFVLRLLVNRVEGEDSATKIVIGADLATEGHRSW
jgi:hypothetical protein